jgi:hypothetical protein
VQAACGEGVGHFQADVAGADDDRGPRAALLDRLQQTECVVHGVQDVDLGCGTRSTIAEVVRSAAANFVRPGSFFVLMWHEKRGVPDGQRERMVGL